MKFEMTVVLLIAALLLGLLAASEIGRRLGLARLSRNPEGLPKGISASEGAVFALLGLLLAFTFSGAASRFEDRRHLVTAETNAIGTAYLRIELLPDDAQGNMRDHFRRYVDGRLETYGHVDDRAATMASLAEDEALQRKIWADAVAASLRPGVPTQAAMLLLPALNETFDITTTRLMAARNHPPPVIFILLVVLSLVGALLVGYGASDNRGRTWLHTIAFAAILSLTIYVIVDLEFPRLGLIRVDSADHAMIDLRESMR